MRTVLDFAPLQRSSVGFDRVFTLLENASRAQSDSWPPFDIIKLRDDVYRINMAVAGFAQSELELTMQPNLLVVTGDRSADDETEYLHRGIANRAFTRRFELADHVRVVHASMAQGLLSIELKREIPEEMKPHRISISDASQGDEAKLVEGKSAKLMENREAA